ncbi:M48 family metallopeptidase [Rhodohalobacter mucosus]|uniref:Peptidase M48 n=1 Tax=Rhodohalobacter mucosus TaxID=2079485 RepID=A0A316U3Z0_9BACT|nr:M48 family metallopeptidase [Rhodohalobacter mucosus]PWN08256.1 peptidase M48 [Rhodohalobacter mucosus]
MNIYTIIILAAIVAEFLLSVVANALNLKSLSKELPGEFEDVYDEDTYARSQQYTRENTRFGFIAGTFNLAVLIAFWFAGGFNWLDQWARSFGYGEVITGLIFIGVLVIGRSLLSLPFSIWSTFVIEERYGFNQTDAKTFVSDLLKGLMLSILIGAPLLAGIIAFFVYGGQWAWVWAWLAVTAFSMIMQYVAPTWIMPLFNKFEPLGDGELRQAIEEYAEKVDFPLQGIYVMDGSKRSSKSNAFFTGFGKNKRIALFDTLIEKHTTEELVAVLAHEIGHYKKKHIVKNMVITVLHTGIMFALLSLFLQVPALFDAFFMEQMSVYAGLLFFGLLYSPVESILGIFMQRLSRKHEYEADRYAANTIEKPEEMVNVLKKLSKDNLSNLTPHPFYVFLNYSHPPVLRRIEEIRSAWS